MKKITLLLVALTFVIFNVQAQDEELVSKKGFAILPEAGDIALGVDFAPFVNTLNFMGGTSTGPRMSFADGLSIFGKYYLEADMAVRVKFAFNSISTTKNGYVLDQNVIGATANDMVEDTETAGWSRYAFAVGAEMRRGHGRLQGYYGADFFFEYANGSAANQNASYTYGNAMDAANVSPASTNFGQTIGGIRTTEVVAGSAMSFGLRGFVGVEYFIAPKISLGGEVGWGVAYQIGNDGSETTEEWDAVSNSVKSITTKNGGMDDQFIVGTTGSTQGFFEQNNWLGLTGNINIIFHF